MGNDPPPLPVTWRLTQSGFLSADGKAFPAAAQWNMVGVPTHHMGYVVGGTSSCQVVHYTSVEHYLPVHYNAADLQYLHGYR